MTIYDNGVIEEIKRVIKIDVEGGDLTIISKGKETTDYDNYVITSRKSVKNSNRYLYTLINCVKPDNSHPTQFKFNYIDEVLDNVQMIVNKDTIARMIVDADYQKIIDNN